MVLRITAYADRLLSDLETVDWPESIKTRCSGSDRRSEGADVDLRLRDHDAAIRVFDDPADYAL